MRHRNRNHSRVRGREVGDEGRRAIRLEGLIHERERQAGYGPNLDRSDVVLDSALATTPRLYKDVSARFRAMRDFIEFLNAPLLARKTTTFPPEYRW